MKKGSFVLLFFIALAFTMPVQAQNDMRVKTLRTLVPYEDLYKVLEKDTGKYFIIPIDEFEQLKSQKEAYLAADTAKEESVPLNFSVYNAFIEGRLDENFAHLHAMFQIEKFTNEPCLIPILYSNAAISEVKLNGSASSLIVSLRENEFEPFSFGRTNEINYFKNPAYSVSNKIIGQSNWQNAEFSLPLTAKGKFDCDISFAVPIKCSGDVLSLRLKTASVPLTFVRLEAPDYIISVDETSFNDYSVEECAFNPKAKTQGLKRGSAFVGQLGTDGKISLRWRKQIAKQQPKAAEAAKATESATAKTAKPATTAAETDTAATAAATAAETAKTAESEAATAAEAQTNKKQDKKVKSAVKEEPVKPKPLIFAKSEALFTVNDIFLHAQKTFNFYVTKAPISTLVFKIPEDAEILSVVTDRANNKRLIRENGVKKLKLDLLMSREGNIPVSIDYEIKMASEAKLLTLPNLIPENIERELETIAIEARTSVELQLPNESIMPIERGIAVIDPAQIPNSLSLKSKRPVLMAFRRSLSSSNITIGVKRYQDTPMQTIAADIMSIKTSFNKNQNSESLIDLTVRNNSKQYLLLRLASNTKVLHTLRDGKPVASVAGKHEGEIQIPLPISSTGESVKTKLQIFTRQPIAPMNWRGLMNFEAPLADVPISRFDWVIYSPETVFSYNFKGNLISNTQEHDLFVFMVFKKVLKLLAVIFKNPAAVFFVFMLIILILLAVSAKYSINALKPIGASIYKFFVLMFQGTSLVTLLIVIAIIALLASATTPNFRTARKVARDKACLSNQAVLSGAIEMYNMENDTPITTYNKSVENTLVQKGFLKAPIQHPTDDCQICSEGDLSNNGYLYCTVHGSHTGERGATKAYNAESAAKVSSQRAGAVEREDKSWLNLINLPTKSSKSLQPKTPALAYGESSTKGHKAIKSQMTLTSNRHILRRNFILPSKDEKEKLQKNSTTPFVSFAYIDKNAVSTINYLAAVLAFFAGIYLSLAAYYKSGTKLAAFIVISAALVFLNKNFSSIDIYASCGLWAAILGAVAIKTLVLCKNKFFNEDAQESCDKNDNANEDAQQGCDENDNAAAPNPPNLGGALLPVLLLIVLFSGASAIAFANEAREVRIMSPFKDLSKVLPEGDRVVIIPEADYRYLTDIKQAEIKPVKPIKPYQILKINYDGRASERGVRFTAKYQIEVYETGYTPIKLQETSVIAAKALIDGNPLSLTALNSHGRSYYGFYANGAGKHEVVLEYFVPYQKNDKIGTKIVKMPVLPVSLASFKLTTSEENSEIWLDPGVLTSTVHKQNKSEFCAILPAASSVNIKIYNAAERKLKAVGEAAAKPAEAIEGQETSAEAASATLKAEVILEPTKLAAVKTSLLYFKDCYVSGTDIFEIQIKGTAGIASIAIKVPNEISVLKADGEHIQGWKTKKENGDTFVEITFENAVHNQTSVAIEYEQVLTEGKQASYEVNELVIPQVEQVSGILGLGALEGLELAVNTSPDGYNPTSPSEFLAKWNRSRPEKTPYAFSFLGTENKLTVDVSRPENLAMQTAAINYAEAHTCLNKEGYVLTRLIYEVCNNSQQFLKVKLPKLASCSVSLWSCAVGGRAVKAGYDKEFDTYNIPIIRSDFVNYEPTPFTVELIYEIKTAEEIKNLSELRFMLPTCHLRISRLIWAVFTPENSEFVCLDSNLERPVNDAWFKYLSSSNVLTYGQGERLSRFHNTSGLTPVAFNLPLTQNKISFNTTGIEPDSKALFIILKAFNASDGAFYWLNILFVFMGALVMASIIGVFAGKSRFAWGFTLAFGIIVLFVAMYFKITQIGQFYSLGAIMALFLFCFYKFMGWREETEG